MINKIYLKRTLTKVLYFLRVQSEQSYFINTVEDHHRAYYVTNSC